MEREVFIYKLLKFIFSDVKPAFSKLSAEPFILKGGASLVFYNKIIKRRIVDIDLSFSMDLLNFQPIKKHDKDSRSFIDLKVQELDKRCINFINKDFIPTLNNKMSNNKFDLMLENRDLNIIIQTKELDKPVVIETGARTINRPLVKKDNITFLSPQITMYEKLFAIHSDNIKEKIHHSHSKFLYDIVEINKYNPNWIYSRELLNKVSQFNYLYYRWNKKSCNTFKIGDVKLFPATIEMFNEYKNDWNNMDNIFYSKKIPYSFDYLIEQIKILESIINKK